MRIQKEVFLPAAPCPFNQTPYRVIASPVVKLNIIIYLSLAVTSTYVWSDSDPRLLCGQCGLGSGEVGKGFNNRVVSDNDFRLSGYTITTE